MLAGKRSFSRDALPILLVLCFGTFPCAFSLAKPDQQQSAEQYRQVRPEDKIHFYSQAVSSAVVDDAAAPFGKSFEEAGYQCGIIGRHGSRIEIPLASDVVERGNVITRDLGILKIVPTGPGLVRTLYATEAQIHKLQALSLSK